MPRACRSTPPLPSACWSAHEHAVVRCRRAVPNDDVTEDGTVAQGTAPADVPAAAGGGPAAVQLPDGFAPYAWAATVAEVAARHGLAPAEVLKFDQNTPALPGVAQIPLAESFATLNAYPDGTYRDLREAAAAYVSSEGGAEVTWDQIVVGAGADDLILLCARTYLAPGRTASIVPPTYALYRIATMLAGADPILGADGADGASLIWRCNPDNPNGCRHPGGRARRARATPSRRCGGRRRGLRRVRRRDRRPLARRVPEPGRAANDVEGLRLRRAPGRVRGRGSGDRCSARCAPGAGADRRSRRADRRRSAPRSPLRPRAGARRARARPRGSRRSRLRRAAGGGQLRLDPQPRTISARASSSRASSSADSRRGSG